MLLFPHRGIERQMAVSAGAGLAAGLLMEIGMYWLLPQTAVRIICWLLYGLVVVFYIYRNSGIRQTGLRERDFGHGHGAFQQLVESQKNAPRHEIKQDKNVTRDELNKDDWGV